MKEHDVATELRKILQRVDCIPRVNLTKVCAVGGKHARDPSLSCIRVTFL